MFSVYNLSIAFAFIFITVVIELVRRNKLHEKYSILWLCFGFVMIVLSVWHNLIDVIAQHTDIKYAPSLLFLVGLIFLIIYSLHITIIISRQNDIIIKLTQELGLLKEKVDREDKS